MPRRCAVAKGQGQMELVGRDLDAVTATVGSVAELRGFFARPWLRSRLGRESRRAARADARPPRPGRGQSREGNAMVVTRRCLTCKNELAPGVQDYCSQACFLMVGRAKHAPGRTA